MMTWLAMGLLSLMAVGFVVAPLVLRGGATRQDRQAINVALYRERVADLTADSEDAQTLEAEAQRGLLSDLGDEVQASEGAAYGRGTLFFAALCVPVLAFILYLDFGFGRGAATDVRLAEELKALGMEDRDAYERILDAFNERSAGRPEDGELGFFISRSYTALGRYDDAVTVYERLMQAFPGDQSLQGYYAEALFLADGRRMTGRVRKEVDKGLSLNPQDVTLLELEGIAAITEGRNRDAIQWFHMALATGVSGQRAELLKQAIASIDPNADIAEGRRLRIAVSAGEEVSVPPESTVFVYARAASGPPAPLAVQKLSLSELPLTVVLTEAMAMMPQMSLANFDEVIVIARISLSGNVVPSPGDLEARSGSINMLEIPEVISLEISDPVSL